MNTTLIKLGSTAVTQTAHNIVFTGGSGRLAQVFSSIAPKSGINVFHNSREVAKASQGDLVKTFRENNIRGIINGAVVSEGPLDVMRKVNVDLAYKIAKAAEEAGVFVLQLSSGATTIDGVGPHTPYALSKLEAEDKLGNLPNVIICRSDVLLGGPSDKIDISHMTKGGIALHLKGEQIFQPTSYRAASIGLANLALLCTNEETQRSLPRIINFAGDPIAVSDFVRMLNEKAFKLHVNPEDLLGLAKVVNNGAFTPEFLYLAMSAAKNPQIHCNADFKRLLGPEKLPTPNELAQEVLEQKCPVQGFKSGWKIFSGVQDKTKLIIESASLLRNLLNQPSPVLS